MMIFAYDDIVKLLGLNNDFFKLSFLFAYLFELILLNDNIFLFNFFNKSSSRDFTDFYFLNDFLCFNKQVPFGHLKRLFRRTCMELTAFNVLFFYMYLGHLSNFFGFGK